MTFFIVLFGNFLQRHYYSYVTSSVISEVDCEIALLTSSIVNTDVFNSMSLSLTFPILIFVIFDGIHTPDKKSITKTFNYVFLIQYHYEAF